MNKFWVIWATWDHAVDCHPILVGSGEPIRAVLQCPANPELLWLILCQECAYDAPRLAHIYVLAGGNWLGCTFARYFR